MMRLKTNKQHFFLLCIREAENLAGIFKVRPPTYGAAKLIKTPGPTRGTPSYKLRWDAGGDGYVAEVFTDITGNPKLRFTRRENTGELSTHIIQLGWDDLLNLEMAENFTTLSERKRGSSVG